MLTHRFDNLCMFLTLPLFYEEQDLMSQLSAVSRVIAAVRDRIEALALIPNPYADETNRISWGKLKVQVGSMQNFPYYGNIFVKVSLTPWQFKTKKIMDSRLDFYQTFYIPVANHWFTVKVELINLQSDGWLREKYIEKVISSFEIRISDLNKPPFNTKGFIKLPLPTNLDYKKYGLGHTGVATTGRAALEIKIVDMTRFDSAIVYNPNRNIMEDRPMIVDYSLKETTQVLNRIKLVISLLEIIIDYDTFIFYFYYPRYTYVCWAFMHLVFIYWN
jgi:hypothetical protein